MRQSVWTADLIDHRRRLHSGIDGIAGPNPAAAARLRLALYTATYEADSGALDASMLALSFAVIDDELTRATATRAA
jgi:hypothetical protein